MSRHPHPSRNGFTLLELLVVLAIASLAVAISIPSLTRTSGVELKATARALAAGLRRARSEAITSNRSATLRVDLEQRVFSVTGENRPQPLPRSIDVEMVAAHTETNADESGAIRFFPDGSSTGGRISVSIDSRGYLLDVDWFTGRVRLDEFRGDHLIEGEP